MHKIKGVFSAALTPINIDYSINSQLFLSHCEWLLSQGVDGLAVFGTTGEANTFNVDEKINSIEYLINAKINPYKLIPGTGQCSAKDTIRFTKKCAELKVRAVLVLPPFFYKNVSDEGVVEYYKRIVEEVGDNNLHYILYNIPQISGVSINIDMIEKLTKFYPNNIIGMKDSSGNLENMLKVSKYFNNFSLFSGSDSLALKVCKRGGAGAITATSNISAKLLSFIIKNHNDEFLIKNFKEIQLLQEKIRETLFTHEPISALKALMSVKDNNSEWNRVNSPLQKIENPQSHKTVIGLIELLKKMDELVPFV
jgi:4-hydroxy-tetrahydrodipicolinate synthase